MGWISIGWIVFVNLNVQRRRFFKMDLMFGMCTPSPPSFFVFHRSETTFFFSMATQKTLNPLWLQDRKEDMANFHCGVCGSSKWIYMCSQCKKPVCGICMIRHKDKAVWCRPCYGQRHLKSSQPASKKSKSKSKSKACPRCKRRFSTPEEASLTMSWTCFPPSFSPSN